MRDSEDLFSWGVWVSLSETNFARMRDLWESPKREQEPPYFGWLSTELPVYTRSTLPLKTHLQTRAVGLRLLIELETTDHPLAVEQREGVTISRVHEIANRLMGP